MNYYYQHYFNIISNTFQTAILNIQALDSEEKKLGVGIFKLSLF